MAGRWGPARGITPEKQRQEKLSAHSHFYSGNARVRWRRTAQWRSARWETDRAPSPQCDRGLAQGYPEDFRPGRFRFLLLGSRASLPKSQGALHHRGPQDLASAGTTANRRLEALAQDRRR